MAVFAVGWLVRRPARQHDSDPAGVTEAPRAEVSAQGLGWRIAGSLPLPLLLIGEGGRLDYANAAAAALFPPAVTGAPISGVIRAPAFIEALAAIRADGKPRSVTTIGGQGHNRSLELHLSVPEGEPGGHARRVLVVIEDYTRERAALKMRSDFVANASHELRTPLASIIGYIETLKGHARDDAEARVRFLDIMERQASRMQRLIDDLLSLSRIELSAHDRPAEVLPLYQVVRDAAALVEPLARQAGVTLTLALDAADPEPRVKGDRDQLQQVIVNLLENAIKYSGSGKAVEALIAVRDPRHPGMTGVTIADNGPGIAREHLPRLTERFYRVSKSASRDKGGTGLGLAICKHILNRHGGALDIQSTEGKGSRFTIWLKPAEDGAKAEPESLRAAE